LTGRAQQEDHAIHLIFAANRWEAINDISADLARGITIIVDRYSYSGAVYSAAKDNPNLSLEWAWAQEVGLPKPDLSLFLHISPQEAEKRGGYGDERYETNEMQSRVRQLFEELFGRLGDSTVKTIDAGRSMDAVTNDIRSQVLDCLSRIKEAGPLLKLSSLD